MRSDLVNLAVLVLSLWLEFREQLQHQVIPEVIKEVMDGGTDYPRVVRSRQPQLELVLVKRREAGIGGAVNEIHHAAQ